MDDLDRLLDAQKAALLAGNLADLADLDRRLGQALADSGGLPAEALARLAHKAEENRGLIEASLAGVRAARRRVLAVVGARNGFASYDQSGRPVSVTPGS
jgi:hypothetical protein